MQFDVFLVIAVIFAAWTLRRAWATRQRTHFLLAGFWVLMVLRYLLQMRFLVYPALIFLVAYWVMRWNSKEGEENAETLKK